MLSFKLTVINLPETPDEDRHTKPLGPTSTNVLSPALEDVCFCENFLFSATDNPLIQPCANYLLTRIICSDLELKTLRLEGPTQYGNTAFNSSDEPS